MLQDANQKYIDIFKKENIRLLEKRLLLLNKKETDKLKIEDESLSIIVKTLTDHGKSYVQTYQIAQMAQFMAESLGLDDDFCELLGKATMLYDIGNIAVKSEIYTKEERLSYEEFEVVKDHTMHGYKILSKQDDPVMQLAAILSLEHHEWWNGGGYPSQLEDEEINIASRIVALADTIGALANRRAGRPKWSLDEIIDYVEKRTGLQFDPEVVDIFLMNIEQIAEILSRKIQVRS